MNTIKHAIQSLLIFIFLTICFAFALIPIRQKAPKYIFFSLTEEQAIRNRSTNRLVNFLNETRFSFDANSTNSLIEVRNLKYIWLGRKISVTYDSALYVMTKCIKRKKLLKLYKETFNKTYARRLDKSSFLNWKRDVFDLVIWKEFFNNQSADTYLFTTQSSETKLPPAFLFPSKTNIKKIMFWYGTNTEPIDRALTSNKRHSNADQLNHYVNQHYVWDQFQSEILMKKGIVNSEVKGSMLFIPRDLKKITFPVPTLLYFDVTPHAKSISPYTEEFCISVLSGVVFACDEIAREKNLKIDILIKPKRRHNKNHSKEYRNLLQKFQVEEKIKILDSTSNIYELIVSVNLTLGIAFTSPVLIAKELNKPGAFVCLNAKKSFDTYNKIKVISNVQELKKLILSTLY